MPWTEQGEVSRERYPAIALNNAGQVTILLLFHQLVSSYSVFGTLTNVRTIAKSWKMKSRVH